MILHTVMPFECIFPGPDIQLTTVKTATCTVETERIGNDNYVRRIISTNPKDYLHGDISIGDKI